MGCQPEHVKAKVLEALRTVYDPEIPVNIVDLGLVYNVKVDEECRVEVVMTVTAPGCPLALMLTYYAEDAIRRLVPEARDVIVKLTFNPPWDPTRITPEGREALKKFFGYDVVEAWLKRVKSQNQSS